MTYEIVLSKTCKHCIQDQRLSSKIASMSPKYAHSYTSQIPPSAFKCHPIEVTTIQTVKTTHWWWRPPSLSQRDESWSAAAPSTERPLCPTGLIREASKWSRWPCPCVCVCVCVCVCLWLNLCIFMCVSTNLWLTPQYNKIRPGH